MRELSSDRFFRIALRFIQARLLTLGCGVPTAHHKPFDAIQRIDSYTFVQTSGNANEMQVIGGKMGKTVLITGDWFIDEYWFITRHHSSMSSHTGQMHFRICSECDDPVKDLCGAGLVARVIYDIREAEASWADPVNIVGLGSWHPLDRDLIAHFIHAQCLNSREKAKPDSGAVISNTYALMPRTCEDRVRVTLYNFQYPDEPYRNYPYSRLPDNAPTAGVTLRVIRTYRFDGTRFQQLNRIDWEPSELPKTEDKIEPIINSIASGLNGGVAIVVEDHNRRQFNEAVTSALIAKSKSKLRLEWYVRSKNRATLLDGKSSWFDLLAKEGQEQTVKLLMIGPEISVRGQPSGRLLANNSKLTRNVFEIIDAIKKNKKLGSDFAGGDSVFPSVENIGFTSDHLEAVFIIGDQVYTWQPTKTMQHSELDGLNWTTALFAALTYELVKSTPEQADNKEMLKRAIGNADVHCGVIHPERLRKAGEDDDSSGEEKKSAVTRQSVRRSLPSKMVSNENECEPRLRREWAKIREDWEAALSGLGIIGGKELQVWRAQTDLPNYIACVDGKRAAIRAIWDLLHRFKMSWANPKSCSVLIEADPGVGKSHLARMLRDALGFDFIHRDITQMLHRDELLDLFDMVATRQAESNDGLLVFVDEINATLDAAPVYGAFLSPLESGFYMRRGIKFNLKPCIWMFAGTRDENPAEAKPTEKLADFRSRLSLLQRIDYRSLQLHCLQQPAVNDLELSLVELNKRLQGFTIAQNYTIARGGQRSNEADKISKFLKNEIGRLHGVYNLMLENQNFEQLIDLDRKARLEQVYLGAMMINQTFPDVRKVDSSLLQFFYRLDPSRAPARSIGRLVGQLQNVQYGKVLPSNCTTSDWEMALRDTGFASASEENLVDLSFR